MEVYFFFLKVLFLFLTELMESGSVIYYQQERNYLLALWIQNKICKSVLLTMFSMQSIKQKGNVVLEEKSHESPYLFISIFSYAVIFMYFYLCKIVLSLIPMKEIKLKHQCHVALWGVRYSSWSSLVLLIYIFCDFSTDSVHGAILSI